MKRYKLKRDLPTFNAGDEFCLNNNNDLYLKDSNIMAYNHITLEKFPNILTDWFEEIHEYKRRRVEIGDLYYFINDCGDINYGRDHNNPWDNYRHSTGNYGLVKKDLETKREYDIARQVLLDDAEGGKWKKDEKNYFAHYDEEWSFDYIMYYVPGVIYFRDEESVEKSLEEHKEQWEIVRKYEMGKLK